MEFIITTIILILLTIVLKFIFNYNIKKLKKIGEDEELDKIASKYPSNIEICKSYLKKLNNENVKIEENQQNEASLYIAVTNKISIANIQKTYTRIQTIAHECLHSVQDRKLLIFNFVFSNIYLLYFITICILALFKILPCKMMFLNILFLFSLVYYMVRMYLENDAMIKARYLAKEYMEEKQISTKEEIKKLVDGFDKINKIGIKSINYNIYLSIIIRILIFSIICIIR